MNVEDLVDGYYDAFMQYLYYDDPSICKIVWNVGSVAGDKTKDTPADRAYLSPLGVRAWKTFSQIPKINQPVRVTYFFQINHDDTIRNLEKIILLDRLLEELSPGSELSLLRYSPISGLDENVTTLSIGEKTTKLYHVFSGYSQIQIGDILSLSFDWIPVSETSLTYRASKFELLVHTDQGGQERVKSTTFVMDPETGCVSELFRVFYKNYFLPREIDEE